MKKININILYISFLINLFLAFYFQFFSLANQSLP